MCVRRLPAVAASVQETVEKEGEWKEAGYFEVASCVRARSSFGNRSKQTLAQASGRACRVESDRPSRARYSEPLDSSTNWLMPGRRVVCLMSPLPLPSLPCRERRRRALRRPVSVESLYWPFVACDRHPGVRTLHLKARYSCSGKPGRLEDAEASAPNPRTPQTSVRHTKWH